MCECFQLRVLLQMCHLETKISFLEFGRRPMFESHDVKCLESVLLAWPLHFPDSNMFN